MPDMIGFQSGVTHDGFNEFVGYGSNWPCGSPLEFKAPGYVSTKPINPGVYMSCATGIQVDNDPKTSYFLFEHPNLLWVNTNNANLLTVNNRLEVRDIHNNVRMFGRIMYNDEYRLGKINKASGFNFIDENDKQIVATTGYQILTCNL